MAPNVANNEHSQKLSWTLENLLYINKTIKRYSFGKYYFVAIS